MIVVDASFMIAALLNVGDAANRLSAEMASPGGVAAPHMLDLEVASVLRGAVHRGEIDEFRAQAALAQLEAAPFPRAPHVGLLMRIWALRHNFSAYDAAYVALAEVLGASLLTRDSRMAKSVLTFTRVPLA